MATLELGELDEHVCTHIWRSNVNSGEGLLL